MKTYEKYKPSGIEWIGDIPEQWEVKKLKYLAKIMNGQDHKNVWDENGKYPIIGTGGEFGKANQYLYSSVSVILGRKGTIDKPQFIETPFWSVDTAYYTNIFETTHPKFFYYCCKTINFEKYKYGSAVPSMSQEVLNHIFFAVPPIAEQTSIADYLDEKTAEIDKLIANKERLIELLKEERTAIINKAVTRGINADAKLKFSGIDWLGDIPEHWIHSKVGYISKVVRGASPRPAGDERLFNGDHTAWITVAEVTKDNTKFITSVSEYLTEEGRKQSRVVYEGTLLLSNSGATLGVPKILKISGCINDGSVAFLNLSEKILIDFLYYFFINLTYTYREQMKGSGQPNLNTDIVKSTPIALPPIEEQKEIVEFIESKTNEIDSTISKIEKEIELIKEYRTALISEVVTGKIKVEK